MLFRCACVAGPTCQIFPTHLQTERADPADSVLLSHLGKSLRSPAPRGDQAEEAWNRAPRRVRTPRWARMPGIEWGLGNPGAEDWFGHLGLLSGSAGGVRCTGILPRRIPAQIEQPAHPCVPVGSPSRPSPRGHLSLGRDCPINKEILLLCCFGHLDEPLFCYWTVRGLT